MLIGLAFVGAYAWKQATQTVDTDPKSRGTTRVLLIGKALERHAARKDRPSNALYYPRTTEFLAFVKALPKGAELLANPYGGPVQTTPVAAGGKSGLPSVAEHKRDVDAPLPDTVLGPGLAPGATYTARTYGALVYDHDPKTDSYVLYGIGRLGDAAVVAARVHSGL